MEPKRLIGPGAGSMKYDVLTALSVAGLHGSTGQQVSMMRLCALVTARYNWRLDEVSVGQRDMARMWNVDERTVKREIKRWTEDRILICKRKGVRGRVGAYRLNIPEILSWSEPTWAAVGPDFSERMRGMVPTPANVVPLRRSATPTNAETETEPSPWGAVRDRLRRLYPDKFPTWLAPLTCVGDDGRIVTLQAPGRFIASYIETHFLPIIAEAVEAEIGPGRRIALTCGPTADGGL